MSNSEIRINDLSEKIGIGDANLFIVEDDEDTKKSNIRELKKSFLGDYNDPDEYKFFSSKKVMALLNNFNIQISSKATQKDVNELYKLLNQIVTSNPNGTKDNEIIEARGGLSSLADRFVHERKISDDLYEEKVSNTAYGPLVDLDGHRGFIDILFTPKVNKNSKSTLGKVVLYSKNIFDLESLVYDNTLTKMDSINGFQYTQGSSRTLINIGFKEQNPGIFYFLSDISFSDDFVDKNISIVLNYKDGTKEEVQYNHTPNFKFVAKKIITSITLKYDPASLVAGSTVTFSNVMISLSENVSEFIPYYYSEKEIESEYSLISQIENNDYIIYCNSTAVDMAVVYNDHKKSVEYIIDQLDKIQSKVENEIDHCGLLTDYGTYQFFDDYQIMSYPESMKIEDASYEYKRNGVNSKKITIKNDATTNPSFKQIISDPLSTIKSISLCFYIDKTVSNNFTDTDGIRIHLSSDDPSVSITNYYTIIIKKSEMVQGWNFIKHQLDEFTTVGDPDSHHINTVSIEIGRNDNLNGLSFYINSIVFNQSMKPTIILSFDGTYSESISYLYPYLAARDIPVSLLINNARTLNAKAVDSIIGYRLINNWDIGVYGCNPNKELLTEDDNYRNQYLALRASREWVQDNFVDSPISYSAPYGNLRPITVPLLKDLGYKIARTKSESYISNFTKYDFAIPMQLISNLTTVDEVKKKIDYAINNGVALSLYTRDVTEYGSEADATQLMFESIINYIIEKRNEGKLQCLTMKDFYERCIN